jgi:hypothetical protein
VAGEHLGGSAATVRTMVTTVVRRPSGT